MSELNEQRWAVVSERGCEAARVTYAEAAELMHRLKGERVYGTCVITSEASPTAGTCTVTTSMAA